MLPEAALGSGVYYSQLNHTLYTIDYNVQTSVQDTIRIYDLRTMTSETLQQPIPLHVHAQACLASSNPANPTLYVTGGFADSLSKLQIWQANEWREGPDMIHWRHSHGCIVVNNWLWVMGGLEAEMEAINISNIDSASWESTGDLGFGSKLISFGIVAVDNLIYVVGGSPDVDTMYIIDTLNKGVANISTEFLNYGMAVVAVDGIMYAFGGGWSSQSLSNSDRWAVYDLLSDE